MHIHTDSQAVVNAFVAIQRLGPDVNSVHYIWWKWLYQAWKERLCECDNPIELRWIPSHLLEDVPIAELDESRANALGSTVLDIANNRIADKEAQRVAALHAPVSPVSNKR